MIFKKNGKFLKPKKKAIKSYPRNVEDRKPPKGNLPILLTMKRKEIWKIRDKKNG